jgi:hypothetical protein
MSGECSTQRGHNKCRPIFGPRIEVKRSLGRPRRRWRCIEVDLIQMKCEDVD